MKTNTTNPINAANDECRQEQQKPKRSNHGMLLTASVLMLQTQAETLADYLMRAMIGGAVWLLFKLIAERIAAQKTKNKNDQPLKPYDHENNKNDNL
ncbi:MAG TPA: hypothetical protein VL093_06940 [Flavipsychrobacter sp.]|nr:hypothetical protein [Flavipsychrobacter sp.]